MGLWPPQVFLQKPRFSLRPLPPTLFPGCSIPSLPPCSLDLWWPCFFARLGQGGCAGPDREGGCTEPDREGGCAGPDREGGCGARQGGRLWGPAGRKALLPAQLRFWQILSSWRSVLCCGEDCCISQWLPFPPRARRASFSSLHHENMVCFLEIKPADVSPPVPTHPLRWWPQEFLRVVLACTWASSNSSRLSFKHSYKSVAQWFLLQISRIGLWFSVFPCLSRCWGGGLTCDLNFLISSRKVIDFQLVQIFVVVDKYRMMTFKFFTCQSWNYIPLIKYFFLDWRSSRLSNDFF